MRKINVFLLIACGALACQTPAPQPSPEPSPAPASTSAPAEAPAPSPSGLELRVGYLARFPMQHPLVSDRDMYLDLYDKDGQMSGQIIVIFPPDNAPTDKDRPIRAEGTVQIIDLGGAPGTKNSYRGEALTVTRWEHLDPAAVPRATP